MSLCEWHFCLHLVDKTILTPVKRYSTRYLTFAVLKKKSYYGQFVTDC